MLRKTLNFEVFETKKRGQPKIKWRRQVEEETNNIGLEKQR